MPAIGDLLTKYDGEWDYMVPDNAPASIKENPVGKGYLQVKNKKKPATFFREYDDLIELDGSGSKKESITTQRLSQNFNSNTTIAFVSIMTAYTQNDNEISGSGDNLFKK